MKAHSFRLLSLPVSLLVAFASFAGAIVINAPVASADVTTHTPVMGPSVLNAGQLAAWYSRHSGVAPQIPAFGGHPVGAENSSGSLTCGFA
jgi:hypothetical protein